MARPLGEPSQEARTVAAVAHGLSFVEGGLIGPLVVWILKKDEDDFAAFHALQSLYFGLAFLLITLVTCGIGGLLLAIPYFVFEGIAALRAYEGQWYELPLVGKWARDRHPGPAPEQSAGGWVG
jgi:hypothetical protein